MPTSKNSPAMYGFCAMYDANSLPILLWAGLLGSKSTSIGQPRCNPGDEMSVRRVAADGSGDRPAW